MDSRARPEPQEGGEARPGPAAEAAAGRAYNALPREAGRDATGSSAAEAAAGRAYNALPRGTSRGGERGVRVAAWAVVALAAAVFLGWSFVPALQTLRHGFPTYYVAARLMWEGRWTPEVYDNAWFIAEVSARTPNGIGEVYAPNPPTAALLALPLAWLDIVTARQVWLWLNLGLFAGALALLAMAMPAGQGWPRAALAAGALLAAPVHENFRLGQVYGLLLFCFTLVVWQLGRRQAGAGAPLGLAAAVKLSGSPVWLVLAARGEWRTLTLAVGVGAVVGALSILFVGWAGWQRFMLSLIEHMGEMDWAAATAFQTLPSFWQHLTRPDPVWNPQPLWELPSWAGRGATLTVSVAALALLWRRARAARLDMAVAAAVTLGVVMLPFAEEYHYTLLVLPFAAALAHLARDGRRVTLVTLGWLAAAALLVAAPIDYKHPWFNDGWHALLAYPRLYGGWLLWGWLMRAMAEPAEADATAKQTA